MYKDATYKKKFADLQKWIPFMMESIKKDLRNDHLKKDAYFVKKFFSTKNIHKITNNELASAYQKAIEEDEKGEDLAEFITSRWLLKHSDLYEFFEKNLSTIDPNFTELNEIEFDKAQILIKESISQFGAPKTYLFSVLNSVVFPAESFQDLKTKAEKDQENETEENRQTAEKLSADKMQAHFEQEMARLTDKYEKKLTGLQKKYTTDVESLKKQISMLQRKIQEKNA